MNCSFVSLIVFFKETYEVKLSVTWSSTVDSEHVKPTHVNLLTRVVVVWGWVARGSIVCVQNQALCWQPSLQQYMEQSARVFLCVSVCFFVFFCVCVCARLFFVRVLCVCVIKDCWSDGFNSSWIQLCSVWMLLALMLALTICWLQLAWTLWNMNTAFSFDTPYTAHPYTHLKRFLYSTVLITFGISGV